MRLVFPTQPINRANSDKRGLLPTFSRWGEFESTRGLETWRISYGPCLYFPKLFAKFWVSKNIWKICEFFKGKVLNANLLNCYFQRLHVLQSHHGCSKMYMLFWLHRIHVRCAYFHIEYMDTWSFLPKKVFLCKFQNSFNSRRKRGFGYWRFIHVLYKGSHVWKKHKNNKIWVLKIVYHMYNLYIYTLSMFNNITSH